MQVEDTPSYSQLPILYDVSNSTLYQLLAASTRVVQIHVHQELGLRQPSSAFKLPFVLFKAHDALGPLPDPQMFPKEISW